MKRRSRSPSPPAAYAKYLNDFEEFEEVQTTSQKMNSFTGQSSKERLESGRTLKSLPSTSRCKDSLQMEAATGSKHSDISEFDDCGKSTKYSNECTLSLVFDSYEHIFDSSKNENNSFIESGNVPIINSGNRFSPCHGNFFDASTMQDIKPKSKSIYDVEDKTKRKSKKICFAFAKFGDCHYGTDCKFSHDPALLRMDELCDNFSESKRSRMETSTNLAVMDPTKENHGLVCKHFEQKFFELQRSSKATERESNKLLKHSTSVKKTKLTSSAKSNIFTTNSKASFNVGGDFIVRVGNSRNNFEGNVNFNELVDHNNSSCKKLKCVDSNHDSPAQISRNEGNSEVKSFDLMEVSDDDKDSDGGSIARFKLHSNALTADKVSTSGSEDLVSDASEEGLLSLSEQGLSSTVELVSDVEVCTDDSQRGNDAFAEPIDFSSVINPNSLVQVSDDDLDASEETYGNRQLLSCRDAITSPFVFSGCYLIFEQLPSDTVTILNNSGIKNIPLTEANDVKVTSKQNDFLKMEWNLTEDQTANLNALQGDAQRLGFLNVFVYEESYESWQMLESTRQALLKYWEGGSVNSVVTLFCWVIMVDVWDDLRRRARTLENHIDTKLVALNKLASGKYDTSVSDKPTVNSKQSIFESLSSELEAMVARLTQINDQMSEHFERSQGAVNNGWVTNPALKHTLRRHREILRDYCTEFRRARDNIGNQIQRESLMSGGTSENSVLNNRLKSNDLYLKEQDHINSCDRLLDEQISIAMNTREHVNKQRLSLRDISKRMQALSKKYPLINSIMQKIQMKKRKDTVVMAVVISGCLILMFLYVMRS